MVWSACAVTTVSADSNPSVWITFDNAKYLFNAGENTIRSHTHSVVNRKKVKALFLTQLGLEQAGGVPGLLLTLGEAGNDLHLVGPKGLAHFLAASRQYTFRDNFRLLPSEIPTKSPANTTKLAPVFKDENITVYALSLSVPRQRDASDDMEADEPLKRKREPSPESPRKKDVAGKSDITPGDVQACDNQPSLAALVSSHQFMPESLPPKLAEEWRQFLIQCMFPKIGVKPEPKPSGSSKKQPSKEKKDKSGHNTKNEEKSGASDLHVPNDEKSGPNAKLVSAEATIEEKEPGNVDDYRRSRIRLPPAFYKVMPPPQAPKDPVCYIIVGPQIRGKFDTQQATILRVPNGPLRAKLTRGETVTFTVKDEVAREDGNSKTIDQTVTVRPEQCIGPSEQPSVVMVLDVPTKNHISSLLGQFNQNSMFSKLRSKKPEDKKEHLVKVLFHMTGIGVLEDPKYVEFMQGFDVDVQHIVASREHCPNPVTFTSAAANQLRLSKLDADIFPPQTFRLEPHRSISDIPNLPRNTNLMVSNMKIGIRPTLPPVKDAAAIVKDIFHPLLEKRNSDGTIVVELSKETQAKFLEAQTQVEIAKQTRGDAKPGDDVVVVALGTGSSVPGKYRTVSATLIQIPEWGNILLDAGEGTYYQMARQFGEEGVRDVLRDLKCIFASHIHADHVLGVAMILRKRLELNPAPDHPLYLVSIRGLHVSLLERQQLEDLGIQDVSLSTPTPDFGNGVIPIMSEPLHFNRLRNAWTGHEPWANTTKSAANMGAMCRSLGLNRFNTVEMKHGTRCFGVVMGHKDRWSIVFSGDTEPTENLVQAGKGATLLIHEATMADDEADLAKAKKHSTVGQAIDIGRRMKAENILLTHFSARYPKIPMTLLDLTGTSASSSADGSQPQSPKDLSPPPVIALALDNSSMRIGDMWKMQHYFGALEQNHKDTMILDGEDDKPTVDAVDFGL